MFDLFLFFHYYGYQVVCSPCRENWKSLPSIYMAFGKVVQKIAKYFNIKIIIAGNWDVWPIFISYSHQGVCSPCRENKKSLLSIYLARRRFRDNVAKKSKNFNIKTIIAGNWDVWPIFIFSLLWSPGCVLNISRKWKKKIIVDSSR